MNSQEFEGLICRMANGEISALDEFYGTYARRVYFLAVSICKNECDADEVVDAVLVKIWNLAPNICDIKNPDAWVYRVALNFTINKIKSSRKHRNVSNDFIEHSNNDYSLDYMFFELTDGLNETERQILYFKVVYRMTFKEIAASLKMSTRKVSKAYKHALVEIRRDLEE